MNIDREKVTKALERCSNIWNCGESCPYYEEGNEEGNFDIAFCTSALARDALELLKEQEAVKPKSKTRHGANAQIQHFCGNCNAMLHGKPKYCSECGRRVNWGG